MKAPAGGWDAQAAPPSPRPAKPKRRAAGTQSGADRDVAADEYFERGVNEFAACGVNRYPET